MGKLDEKTKDLIQTIAIKNPLRAEYEHTNILSPRTYLQSLKKPLPHVAVQCILLADYSSDLIDKINHIIEKYPYNRTNYDKPWVSTINPNKLDASSKIIIMNRRIGGWDGSLERPVIELLGAGGHVNCQYDSNSSSWKSASVTETAIKETGEEIGLELNESDIIKLGGFFNEVTQQLVILVGIKISSNEIYKLQEAAYQNSAENTDGLYFGEFTNVMQNYLTDATPFAGGEKAKPTNFPSNKDLMGVVHEKLIFAY